MHITEREAICSFVLSHDSSISSFFTLQQALGEPRHCAVRAALFSTNQIIVTTFAFQGRTIKIKFSSTKELVLEL